MAKLIIYHSFRSLQAAFNILLKGIARLWEISINKLGFRNSVVLKGFSFRFSFRLDHFIATRTT